MTETAEVKSTVAERYAIATTSGNLTPSPAPGLNRITDADRLLAAAYAAGNPCGRCNGTGRQGGVLPAKMGDPRCDTCNGSGRIVDQRKSLALSAWRMKHTGDRSDLYTVVSACSGWLAGRMTRSGYRPMNAESRRMLVLSTLHWWLDPTCEYCCGRRKLAMETAGRLTEIPCEACFGEKTRPLAREVPHAHVKHAEWLETQLDQLLRVVFKDMAKVLNDRMEL